MRILRYSLSVILSLFAFSWVSAQSIEGTWEIRMPDDEGNERIAHFTAKEGSYQLDFNADGEIEVTGKYELADGQMTIWDTGGDPKVMCPGEAKGVYAVTITDAELTMKMISDECEGRGSIGVITMTRK